MDKDEGLQLILVLFVAVRSCLLTMPVQTITIPCQTTRSAMIIRIVFLPVVLTR